MKKWIISLVFTSIVISAASQNKKGYWDTMRATSESLELSAGEKKILKSNPLPEGTTELVYRITVLDDNQKLSSSLVAVLKAIPDPTGISQGAAGAVFLASTLSGSDKTTFALFTSEKEAQSYFVSGKTENACYVQNNPVNKEARLLPLGHLCLKERPSNLWFGFRSDNWLLKQKILLEVVPWVDYDASKGWVDAEKKELVSIAKQLEIYSLLHQKEAFQVAFVKQVMEKSTCSNFKKLDSAERNQLIIASEKEALLSIGETDKRNVMVAASAYSLFSKGKTEAGINRLQAEIHSGTKAPILYATLIKCYLQTRQFEKATRCLNEGKQFIADDLHLLLAEAHVDLFTDKIKNAKKLYKKYTAQNFSNGTSWKTQVLQDFEAFERSGLPISPINKIKRLLE